MLKPGLSAKIQTGNEIYSSYIEDLDDEALYLATPIKKGTPVTVRNDSKLKIYIIREGAMYEFNVEPLQVIEEPLPLIKIPKPKKVRKIQRRGFYRLEKTIPVKYYVLDENGEEKISEIKQAVALDISGGGVKLSTPEIIPVGTYLELTIYLEDESGDEPIICPGEVMHSKKIDTERVKTYHYGISFISLPVEIQDRIVRFIFEEQRRMRQKGRFS